MVVDRLIYKIVKMFTGLWKRICVFLRIFRYQSNVEILLRDAYKKIVEIGYKYGNC